MERGTQEEREVRAARNQAMFRAVNEQLSSLNEAFEAVTNTFTIACECADDTCVEMVAVAPEDYEAVRKEPRRFVVMRDHVEPDVEVVVDETAAFLVVEKIEAGGNVAETLA
jgi:hypothetical protein